MPEFKIKGFVKNHELGKSGYHRNFDKMSRIFAQYLGNYTLTLSRRFSRVK